jgi:hypothetical protein
VSGWAGERAAILSVAFGTSGLTTTMPALYLYVG